MIRGPSTASIAGTTSSAIAALRMPTVGAGHADRVQEPLRHQHQRGHRAGDGQAGEQRRPAGGRDRPPMRLPRRSDALHLLAVARDHQQGVVDGEAEAQRGRDVEGEQRGVDDAGHHPQGEQGPEDRQHPDHQRYGGRHHAAEDDQQQHRQDRERDQLRVGQVLAGLVVDLVEARREPAVADVEQIGSHPLPHRLVGEPAFVLDVRGRQLRRQHQRPAVLGGSGGHVADVRRTAQLLGEPVDLRLHLGIVGVQRGIVGRSDEHDETGLGGEPEVLGQRLAGPLALRRRVGEAGRLQVVLDVVTEERRRRSEQEGGDQDLARVVPRQAADPLEHPGNLAE